MDMKLIEIFTHLRYEGYLYNNNFCFYSIMYNLNFEIVYNSYGFFTFQYFKHSQEEPTILLKIHKDDITTEQFKTLETELYNVVRTIDNILK